MKKIAVEEFKAIGQKIPSAMAELAKKLIEEFDGSDADVMEVESSDLDDKYNFDNKIELNKAANLLRGRLARNDMYDRYRNVCIKQRGNRLFICRFDAVDDGKSHCYHW